MANLRQMDGRTDRCESLNSNVDCAYKVILNLTFYQQKLVLAIKIAFFQGGQKWIKVALLNYF